MTHTQQWRATADDAGCGGTIDSAVVRSLIVLLYTIHYFIHMYDPLWIVVMKLEVRFVSLLEWMELNVSNKGGGWRVRPMRLWFAKRLLGLCIFRNFSSVTTHDNWSLSNLFKSCRIVRGSRCTRHSFINFLTIRIHKGNTGRTMTTFSKSTSYICSVF